MPIKQDSVNSWKKFFMSVVSFILIWLGLALNLMSNCNWITSVIARLRNHQAFTRPSCCSCLVLVSDSIALAMALTYCRGIMFYIMEAVWWNRSLNFIHFTFYSISKTLKSFANLYNITQIRWMVITIRYDMVSILA